VKKKGIKDQSYNQRLHPQIKRRLFILAGAVFIFFASVTLSLAHTFSDSLENGLETEFWTLSQTTPGLYSFDDTQGNFTLAKTAMQNPGGLQNVGINLNLANLGGNITGDFTTQVSFSNVVLPNTSGSSWNQFQFELYFQDGSFSALRRTTNLNGKDAIDVYSSIEGYVGSIASTAIAGTFTFSRSGSTLSSYFNGVLRNTENNNATLTQIRFVLQNNSTNDFISVVCNDFSLTADSISTPEPNPNPPNIYNGLVAYYPFDGDSQDHSGNKNDGIVHGAELIEDKAGNQEKAYSFDGIDDYITIPPLINGLDQFTFSFWVNVPEFKGSYYPPFIGSSNKDNMQLNNFIGIAQSTQHLFMEVYTETGSYSKAGNLVIPWNEWIHVAMVYDGSNLSEYINNTKGQSVPASGKIENIENMYIATFGNSGNHFLKANIDDVRIYNRALSHQEINQLYYGDCYDMVNEAILEERKKWDVNDDGKIGLEEVINALQFISKEK